MSIESGAGRLSSAAARASRRRARRAREPSAGHWIERGPQKRLMVFSGRSHPELAQRIAEQLGVELGEVELKTFANGETYCRYDESIRGADVFLVQTGCQPVDQQPDGAAVHDPGGEARVGEADHGRHPVVPVLAPGQEVEAARADLRAPRRRHAPARRRRPRADDGPARGPDPGLLHDPGRPHDRAAALRAALPRPRPAPARASSPSRPTPGRAKMARPLRAR